MGTSKNLFGLDDDDDNNDDDDDDDDDDTAAPGGTLKGDTKVTTDEESDPL
jgi:hypothetical protein